MKKIFQAAGSLACSVLLLLGLLCGITLTVANDASYMSNLFLRHADPSVTGVDSSEYPLLAKAVTAYLAGNADTFQTTLSVHGQLKPAFSEKELAHMRDVQGLFALCRTVFYLCLAAVLLFLALSVRRPRILLALAARQYLHTGLFTALVGAAIAVWAALDFHTLFTMFHRLFFTNDLWLLNPHQDLLLQLMPTGFFIDYAARIGLFWLSSAAVIALAAILYLKRRKKNA